MRVRIPFAAVCFSLVVVVTASAQLSVPSSRIGTQLGSSTINGTLYGADGAPLSDIAVELRDPSTESVLATTYSGSNGAFTFGAMPQGSYELVARAGSEEGKQFITAYADMNRLDLRLDHPITGQPAPGGTVSVAQLKVPQRARDRYVKAQQAFGKEKYDQAEKAVNEALAVYPQYAEAITLRGLLYLQKGDAAKAMDDFRQAIVYDPNYSTAYTAMGAIYNDQGKFDDATRTTERAVQIAPNAWQGYFEMAKAFVGKGLYEKALQMAEKAQALGANSLPSIHLVKAYAMVPLKLYKQAGQELQAFLSHAPNGQNVEPVKRMLARVQAAEAAGAIAPSNAEMSFATH